MLGSSDLLVGTRKGLFILAKNGNDWNLSSTAFEGVPVTMVYHDRRSSLIYAAVGHGHFGAKLHRSEDGGKNWKELTPPVYPPKPDDVELSKHPFTGGEIQWSLDYIWELQAGLEEGHLWCGTIPGALFYSTDHGESWTVNEELWNKPNRAKWFGGGFDGPGIHSVCVDPRDRNKVKVAVSCGGVWCTEDNGKSWEPKTKGMRAEYVPPELADDPDSQDPHLMAACPSNPDALWIQHHNGIFVSMDGAENWKELTDIDPSTFGFAVAVHPEDGNTAWFAPAVKDEMRIPCEKKVVVTRTRDGGETFEKLTNGLPQENAWDIFYRHCLCVDDSGNRLALGSTTGNLWTTENGGDSWNHWSAHLPLINVVRFA